MELTRNHYFIVGILLLLLGLQFRYVQSFVLNEKSTQFIEKRFGPPPEEAGPFASLLSLGPQFNRRVVHPPRWLGFSLLSIGGVLFLYSLSMKKPGA